MNAAVTDVLSMRAAEPETLRRTMRWSFAVHVGAVVLALVVPRDWITTDRTPPRVMTINLGGGTVGPRTTGQSPIGGRPVEQVAPTPRRPEPIPPVAAPPRPSPAATATRPPARPAETPRPAAPATRPPSTGERVVAGNTPVETGAQGQGAGLTYGGGTTTAAIDLNTFCCPEYIALMQFRIETVWRRLPGRGTTIIQFAILRDGRMVDFQTLQSSGSGLLDREAMRTLQNVTLTPLPQEYREERLVIRLSFPYGTPTP